MVHTTGATKLRVREISIKLSLQMHRPETAVRPHGKIYLYAVVKSRRDRKYFGQGAQH